MKIKNKQKDFNLIIAGIGGQGLLTLLRILSEAALFEGKDIKTSELHGLSQRGGSVKVHFRLGKEIFSPLVTQAQADLIIALEIQEALKVCYFASKEKGTIFLVNDLFISLSGKRLPEKISPQKKNAFLKKLKKFSKQASLVPAIDICEKEFGTSVTAAVYLMALACHKKLIPLKEKSIIKAIEKVMPPKYLELNLKTFNSAKNVKKTYAKN